VFFSPVPNLSIPLTWFWLAYFPLPSEIPFPVLNLINLYRFRLLPFVHSLFFSAVSSFGWAIIDFFCPSIGRPASLGRLSPCSARKISLFF